MRHSTEFQAAIKGRRAGRPTLVAHLAVPAADSRETGASQHGPFDLSAPRIGFIVSRAVGGAVTRNRVRRRLRHLVGPYVATLPAGSLLVIRALPSAGSARTEALGRDVDAVIRRVLLAAAP